MRDLSANIPSDVVELLRTAVPTYEALDALLLVRRGTEPVSAKEVARALGVGVDVAEGALGRLAESGVIEQSAAGGVAQYGGVRAAMRPVVDRLADAYRDRRVDIVVVMNNHAVERLRSGALRAFADAFVIRRKDG